MFYILTESCDVAPSPCSIIA